jgi:8-oxo-dGTP diphosphatase
MNITTIGNVCFLIDQTAGNILLLERSREPMRGLLTGVGGKTDFAEDIQQSCMREIKEETGLDVKSIQLKGILKTLAEDGQSSWILFVYTCTDFTGRLKVCEEGNLQWFDITKLDSLPLIGFIKLILPEILTGNSILEGTITHDKYGNVVKSELHDFSALSPH